MRNGSIFTEQSLMSLIEVNRVADMLHGIGFRADTMHQMLAGLLSGEKPRSVCHCQKKISNDQMADLNQAIISAGFTARTAEYQLINDRRPWQEIFEAIKRGDDFSLPEPTQFVPPQLEICK